jgi:hypothetical protein
MLRLHAEMHVHLHMCFPLLLTFNQIWYVLTTLSKILVQGYTTLECQVMWVTEFCIVAHNICSSHVLSLLHVTLLGWLLDIMKICAPLSQYYVSCKSAE